MNKYLSSPVAASAFLALGLAVPVIVTHSAPVQPKHKTSAQSQKFEQPYELPTGVDGLVLSTNGKFAAYFGSKANVTVVDLSARKILWEQVEMSWEITRLAVSSNGLYLAGTGLEQNQRDPKGEMLYMVYIVNMQTKKMLKVPGYSQSLAFSPDSKSLIAAGLSNNGLVSYDVNTGKKIHIFWKEQLTGYMNSSSMKFSPNAKLLAVGSAGGNSDGHVRMWNLKSGELIHDFTKSYTPIVFSTDSTLLATSADDPEPEPDEVSESNTESSRFGYQDFAVKLWNLANGRMHVLKHEGRQIEGTADPEAFSLNGRLLLTTNGDLWDVKTHKFIGRRETLSKRGREIRFSRNGGFIVTDIKSRR